MHHPTAVAGRPLTLALTLALTLPLTLLPRSWTFGARRAMPQGPRDFEVAAELVYAVPNCGERSKILNAGALRGNIALFDRGGEVPMVEKVLLAQAGSGSNGLSRAGRPRCPSAPPPLPDATTRAPSCLVCVWLVRLHRAALVITVTHDGGAAPKAPPQPKG